MQNYTPSSYSCRDLAEKSQEHASLPQNLEKTNTIITEKDLGKNLGPWQEHVVGNDPTGRNHGRAAGGGDPATNAGSVLERGRERGEVGEELRMGMGS